ncbi:hypothetical protein [Prosthecobacter sp.]|uniref:hypothetical protein n=1 Tax=Prosthecobacter sp. TaxID=1965333 RepID=UPI003784D08A
MHLIRHFIALTVSFLCVASLSRAQTMATQLFLPNGTLENRPAIGEHSTEVIWHPKSGGHEHVHTTSGGDNNDWTIEAAFASEGVLSLCRGASTGALEHWQFRKSGSDWKLAARAFLGSGTDVYGVTMPDAQTIEFGRKDRTIDRLTVSNRPIGGNSLYREVMINGKELRPYSRDVSVIVITGEKVPEGSSPQSAAPPLKSVPALPSVTPQKAPSSVPLSQASEVPISATAWSFIAALAVVALGLVCLLLKRRG